ncbi:hypothetical protein EXIGLDRAFT_847034 [Exidia glandulosa HHB12029]|uniref:J domain-containing protein n=1 Tax=Exidia glandulosa HHB12029 TaxID=1314781 RepID=A0A166NA26_EXIGL|nr:hypothetical protein EXIGLDRAFT_847034 [Exidia glandulosa HHB12029]
MVQYSYDEGGAMSSYFVLTFLSLFLIPVTLSFVVGGQKHVRLAGCQCQPCIQHREEIRKSNKRTILHPQVGAKAAFTAVGWAVFAYFAYKVATTKSETTMYDPYEILGIKRGTTEQEIKRHYKRMSLMFHPDKVKLAVNETLEMVSARFVDITKAYKSLTNEEIRKNWEEYGHPDGKQDFSMGLAIPRWVVEGQNNIYVLIVYGILFGAGLPYLVGKWWFGSRQTTKDGVKSKTAEDFFKAIREDSGPADMFLLIAKAWGRESNALPAPHLKSDVGLLREKIDSGLGNVEWREKVDDPVAERALVLLYAHLLRIPIKNPILAAEQRSILLHTPTLLTSLLSMTTAHSWLGPTLNVLRMHQILAQAMAPETDRLTIFPGVDKSTAAAAGGDLKRLLRTLEEKNASSLEDVRKTGERWGSLELVDAGYKVIGEKVVTPSAIMQLVFKLRLTPPLAKTTANAEPEETDVDKIKQRLKLDDEADEKFLAGKKDAEDLEPGMQGSGYAHAPYWPANRKPSWWAILADFRTGKVVVPPMRFTDVPYSDPSRRRNYRTYKMQIQAPPQAGTFMWRLVIISDTFIGEDIGRDLPLQIVEVTEEQQADVQEDEISDPDEDTLAGQMASMRGGQVKRKADDSEDESSDTDGDAESDSSSDSDSD